MPTRIVAVMLASALALTSVAQADPVHPVAATFASPKPLGEGGPIRDSLARLTLTAPAEARVQSAPQRDGEQLVKRIVFASILGFAGFLAGGKIGARIDGDCGGCDDPGLKGALIGAPIGGTIGAIVGWKITR